MRFSVFIASAFAAVAAAQSATTSSEVPMSSVEACVESCDPKDLDCLSRCNPVPNPDKNDVAMTDKCIRGCDQGDGSAAESKAYAECRNKCIEDYFYSPGSGTPKATDSPSSGGSSSDNTEEEANTTATTAANSSKNTDSSDEDSEDSSSSSSDSNESSTDTGDAAQETGEDGDSGAVALAGSAALGLFAAVLAL